MTLADALRADAALLLAPENGAEQVTYRPSVGSPRTILAFVSRLGYEFVDQNDTLRLPVIELEVLADAAAGVVAWRSGDEVDAVIFAGDALQTRCIVTGLADGAQSDAWTRLRAVRKAVRP